MGTMEPDHKTPFSDEFQQLIRESRLLAMRLGNAFITSNHFLMLLLQGDNSRVQAAMQALGVPVDELKEEIAGWCRAKGAGKEIELGNVPLVNEAEGVIKQSVAEFIRRQGTAVGAEHILLAMAHNPESEASQALARFGFSYDAVAEAMGYERDV
jgi:ATP-dependent Clp protease ATP-binding subunit ClpC